MAPAGAGNTPPSLFCCSDGLAGPAVGANGPFAPTHGPLVPARAARHPWGQWGLTGGKLTSCCPPPNTGAQSRMASFLQDFMNQREKNRQVIAA